MPKKKKAFWVMGTLQLKVSEVFTGWEQLEKQSVFLPKLTILLLLN